MFVLFMVISRRTETLPHSEILQETNFLDEFSKIWKEGLYNVDYSVLSLSICLFMLYFKLLVGREYVFLIFSFDKILI